MAKQKPKPKPEGAETRRGHNEGSWLYLDELDKWKFRVSAKTPDGITVRFAVTASTKGECRELSKARAEQIEKGIGLNIDTKNITVTEYLERWLVDYSDPDTAASTKRIYRSLIKNQLTEGIGSIPLKKLQRAACQRHFNNLAKRGLSSATVSLAHTVLRAALKQAARDKIISENPASDLKLAQIKNAPRMAYTSEEVSKILKLVEEHELGIGFHLLFGLALREGEMLGLKWKQIKLPDTQRDQAAQVEGKAHIVEQLNRNKGEAYAPLKTKESERTLPVSPALAIELRGQKIRQKAALLKAGIAWNEDFPVVSDAIGDPISHTNFLEVYKEVMQAAGLKTTGTHDARHTRLTMLANSGMDTKTLSRFAGHADVAFTLNVYVTSSDEKAAAAVNQLDQVIYKAK